MNKGLPLVVVFTLAVAILPSITATRHSRQQQHLEPEETDELDVVVLTNEDEVAAAQATMNDDNSGNITLIDGARTGCTGCCGTPTPPPDTNPSYPSITYATNCDFCDHDLYTLTCVSTPFACAARCAIDSRCTHFTYIAKLNGGTCRLKSAPGSGGAWASMTPPSSGYICGYIPKRAFTSIFLSICLGLDINIGTGIILH